MSSPEFFRQIKFFPVFDETRCTHCFSCLGVCGLDVYSFDKTEGWLVEKNRCRNCRSCVAACPSHAIAITATLGGMR